MDSGIALVCNMSRIKIELPEHLPFTTLLDVRITDLNYGNHVGNDRFLVYAQEARTRFLAHLGYTELSMEQVGLIMVDAALEFKHQVDYGMTLEVGMGVTNITNKGFDLLYRLCILQPENASAVAARIKTAMLCFDYTTQKIASLPLEARQRFLAYCI